MNGSNWLQKQRLFDELLDLDAIGRQRRLEEVTSADRQLADELGQLLTATEIEHVEADFTAAVETLLSDAELPAGLMVGPYRVTGLLGKGGMGSVYCAVHEQTSREVAIKVLSRLFSSPRGRERFEREYRLVASLDDEPRIARLFEAGVLDDGTPWFAMELVRGGEPITEHCARRGASLQERLALFREVCRAVRHAHSRAVIHRDLKPSNILVSEAGEVRLLDFGIAGTLADLATTEADGEIAAQSLTPAFAAPEQLAGEPVGAYSDLFVLGAVLYELLTGRRPFEVDDTSAEHVLHVMRTGAAPPSSHRLNHIRGAAAADWSDLDAICLRLLASDPRQRYATAESLLADLDRFKRHHPIGAREHTVPYRMRKFVARHRFRVVAGTAALLVIAGLSAWYGVRLSYEREENRAQAARTQRLQQFMLGLFAGAEPDVGPARELTVRRLLERGVLTADMLTADPDIHAELTHTLGTLFGQLGDFDRAETLLSQSLEVKARLLSEGHPRRVEGQIAMAALRADQMKLDEAEALVRSAARGPRVGA